MRSHVVIVSEKPDGDTRAFPYLSVRLSQYSTVHYREIPVINLIRAGNNDQFFPFHTEKPTESQPEAEPEVIEIDDEDSVVLQSTYNLSDVRK